MSLLYPEVPTQSRRGQTAMELRAQQVQKEQHERAKQELLNLSQQQRERIQKLRLESAVQLEHHANLRKSELEKKLISLKESIAIKTPKLENLRGQWGKLKNNRHGYEMQWGSLRQQYNNARNRLDQMKNSIEDTSHESEELKRVLREMREHLQELERDKATIQNKTKHALECLVTDDNYLDNRVREEEEYAAQMEHTYRTMEEEYNLSQAPHSHEYQPLEKDADLLMRYLKENQRRTDDLYENLVKLEGKLSGVEDNWLKNTQSVYEELEQVSHMLQLKGSTEAHLERLVMKYKAEGVKPRPRTTDGDAYWLANGVDVWESIVQNVTQEKQRYDLRSEPAQLLADSAQRTQQARSLLQGIEQRIDGGGNDRKQLLQDIGDLRYLAQEKRDNEEHLMKFIQQLAASLDEDLPYILRLIRKEGFDDYVSSTDEDEDIIDDRGFASLPEEGYLDVEQLISSMDIDLDDPSSLEVLRRMSHRPVGPLADFVERRKSFLMRPPASGVVGGGGRRRETIEQALMDVQVRVSSEVVQHVSNRERAIKSGSLDPRKERMMAEAKYNTRMKEMAGRVDRWVSLQKLGKALPQSVGGGNVATSPSAQWRSSQQRGVSEPAIELGLKDSAPVANSNPVSKALYYLGRLVVGETFMLHVPNSTGTRATQVYLTRDLRRLQWREAGSATAAAQDAPVVDVTDVRLGHRTDNFRQHKAASRQPMREELAFSVVLAGGVSLDLATDSVEQRNYWAHAIGWVVNESRDGGAVHTLLRANRIHVVDTKSRLHGAEEPCNRENMEIQLIGR